ncbi:hypothetical protein P691DRAFT_723760 [Macrolepiota fuliginosa MF-IS2]|uniref:Lanthionine synthetase C family protein n=1 Tax=Macrolepiota fuliginosa MF-IS2 TaxID=1400762 RepID=A0A9P5XJJ3_9AGAR|nr:hypothetical protein P691DRAFT_723760 [Macrolepiota fuliginosa MF-IS2]
MSTQRYIHLFTEPPKGESDWRDIRRDIEDALRKNVQRVQQETGSSEGRKGSVYLGDIGVTLMEVTIAERRRDLPNPPQPTAGEQEEGLSHALLTSLADHHLASAFHDGGFNPQSLRDGAHSSFLETSVGITTLILSRYPIGKQKLFARTQWKRSRDHLQKVLKTIESDDKEFPEDDDGCDVLYGRAGFLYALLYLRSVLERAEKRAGGTEGDRSNADEERNQDLESCQGLFSDMVLETVVRSIMHRGRNGAKTYRFEFGGSKSPPLTWAWHSKRYLGGAHGVAGILQMLLRCPFPLVAEYMPEIVQTIDWLIDCQDRIGNWPTRAPDLNRTTHGEHELVQWCHGAPAMLILLSTILRMSVTPGITTGLTDKQQERFVVSLQRGCALVYMRGVLRKGVGLCHGIAGSIYALLAASDVLDEPCNVNTQPPPESAQVSTPLGHFGPYFTQAGHLAHSATHASSLTEKGEMKTPDHPWSLYEGMAGMCCAWEEILYRMSKWGKCLLSSGMPGYDDLIVRDTTI